MSAYYDQKKRKYIVDEKEFPDQPSTIDYVKEGFQDSNTKAQLEALRRRRDRSANGTS